MWDLGAPLWLLCVPLPWLWWWYCRKRPVNQPTLVHPRTLLIEELKLGDHVPVPWLWLLGMSALFLALSQPHWHDPDQVRQLNGRDIVLALDMSASMRAEDFELDGKIVNRFEAVRDAAKKFIRLRPQDRVGLIVFGDDAYTLAPLTFDHSLAVKLLDTVELGMAGDKTALGDALALAIKRLPDDRGRERIVVLFSDGAVTSGTVGAADALSAAVGSATRIHSIGIGGGRSVPFSQGPTSAPLLATVPLDDAFLRQLAQRTGGEYFSGSDSSALTATSHAIDRIEADTQPLQLPARAEDVTWLPLVCALILIAAQRWRQASAVFPYPIRSNEQ